MLLPLAVLVQATVQAPLAGDLAATRAAALDQALADCVAHAAGGTLPDAVRRSARGFVDRYRILVEDFLPDRVELTVEAEIAEGRLARALAAPRAEPPAPPRCAVLEEAPVRGAGVHAARARVDAGAAPVEAWGFGADAEAARAAACRAAGGAPADGAARFDLTVQGIDSPATLARLRQALADGVRGVRGAALRTVGRGRATFRIEAERPPTEIASALLALPFDGFHLEQRPSAEGLRLEAVSP